MGWADWLGAGAGEAGRAVAAAEALWQRGRQLEAVEALGAALEGAPASDRARAGLWVALGECRLELDELAGARAAFLEAIKVLGAGEGDQELVLRARVGLTECLMVEGDADAVDRALAPVRDRLGLEGDARLRERAGAVALAVAVAAGADHQVRALELALAELGRLGAAGSRWRVTMGVGRMLELRAQPLHAVEWLAAARSGETAASWPAGVGPAAYAEARVQVELGRLVEADLAIEVALGAARAQGDRGALRTCLGLAVDLGVALGVAGGTVARLLEAADLARDNDDPRGRARLLMRALTTALGADLPEAGAVADALADVLAMLGPSALQPDDAFPVATALADAGRAPAATDVLVRASQLAFGNGEAGSAAACLAEAARMAQRSGEGDLASAMWEEVVELGVAYGLEDQAAWESEWRHRFPDSAGAGR